MNLINKILILIILIFLINHLSNGQLSNNIKNTFNTCKNNFEKTFNTCKNNVEKFVGLSYNQNNNNCSSQNLKKQITLNVPDIAYQSQKDFSYNNHNDNDILDDETYGLYKVLNNLVTVNVNIYELTPNDSNRIKVSDEFKKEIYDELNKLFNYSDYSFNDITFLSELYYYKNYRGKTIEPFEFKANIAYKNNLIGTVVIYIESFMRDDKFYYQKNKTGFLTLQTVKLINRTYPDGKNKEKIWRSAYKLIPTKNENLETNPQQYINKTENQAIQQNIELSNKMVESFTEHFVNIDNDNDLFIKPLIHNKDNIQTDTENSLIPSNIEFSAC
jgi:hypothetical protein